ncbi:type II toxin-antitoxin system HicB family antitoxin [Bradyrhizobium sp. URHD0069]|uniref:type II toxin-antitoxin system HicB family antitoxin n=1 Tax=Bradyrhizobium sp. URHD0069 TaxID=1380355 RepID=UPI0004983C12|nr:type II toxin-antitoxin system HicB family antitoxin [Bradyrhizobium sp. URHD0069]
MTTFIAIVRSDSEYGYTASFPDFPGCAASASTLDHVIAKAREALSLHIERLLEANQRISSPTAADAIERGDAVLLAAIDVPDDLRIAHVDVAIPALSLARIDSFARRHGLTHAALFVEAVDRWAMQEIVPRERRGGASDGPTLFDFSNPLELRVEAIAGGIKPEDEAGARERDASVPETVVPVDTRDITAELERLLEESAEPQPSEEAADDWPNRPAGKPV